MNQDAAAYVGYSYGLCSNYTNSYAWEDEEHTMPMRRLLHLDVTQTTLSATTNNIRSAGPGSVWKSFILKSLGLGRKEDFNDEGLCSDRVTQTTRILPEEFPGEINLLISAGESALEPRFLSTVGDAIRDLVETTTLTTLSGHPDTVFAAARGPAEFAK
jgi:hypothetical protein